jgi:uncharacterized protein YjlB
MRAPETYRFAGDGRFPNSTLPLLVYRGAIEPDADTMERCFERNGWSGCWRNGIFPFHHFHGTAHEVLGIAAGEVRVAFGGPAGEMVTVRAGDVVVIPAGVGHCNRGQSPGLLVIGAYPGGAEPDLKIGEPGEYAQVCRAVACVPLPARDPVQGQGGLLQLWPRH